MSEQPPRVPTCGVTQLHHHLDTFIIWAKRQARSASTPDRDGYTIGVYLPPGVSQAVREQLGDRIAALAHQVARDVEVVGTAGDPLGAVDGVARP